MQFTHIFFALVPYTAVPCMILRMHSTLGDATVSSHTIYICIRRKTRREDTDGVEMARTRPPRVSSACLWHIGATAVI